MPVTKPVTKPADKAAWSSAGATSTKRRSMRVLLSIPVSVTGKTAKGDQYSEETRTLVVNAHGALVALASPMAAQQKVSLTNLTTHDTLDCTVTHLGTVQAGKTQIGLEFVSPAPGFWKIDFPPDDWVVPED